MEDSYCTGYTILAEVGDGAYGRVYKAREDEGEQRLVAVKKLNYGANPVGGIPPLMVHHVALLHKLADFNHPNIVNLLEAFSGYVGSCLGLTLVFEYIDQDLPAYISNVPSSLGLDKIKGLMVQLLRGLDFLHTNSVVHRDLKPENILVSSSGQVKIADFGLSRIHMLHPAPTPQVVPQPLWYRAPEVLLRSAYMSPVDMWSAGCILAELSLFKPLFQGYTYAQQLHKIFKVIGVPMEEDWPMDSPTPYFVNWGPEFPDPQLLPDLGQEGNDLLTQCLAFKPTHRISASEALAHSFFNESPGSPAPPQET